MTSQQPVIRVLFVGASPKDEARLRLDEEVRSIDESLRQADFGESFTFTQALATRVTDLQNAFLRYKPHIVHFGGHGDASGGIVFEDASGQSQVVSVNALEQLFMLFKDEMKVVILNACQSYQQADAIAKHIDFVVGMSESISDDAAIAFSTSFYRALAYGKTMQTAFDLARNEISLRGITGDNLPQLLTKAGIVPTTAILDRRDGSTEVGRVRVPRCELLSARLECSPPTTNPNPESIYQMRPEYVESRLIWRVSLSVFVEAQHGEVLTIPLHRCNGWYDDTYSHSKIPLNSLTFRSGGGRITSDGVTLSISGAGNVTVEGQCSTPHRNAGFPPDASVSIRCPILELSGAELPLDVEMRWLPKDGWPIVWEMVTKV